MMRGRGWDWRRGTKRGRRERRRERRHSPTCGGGSVERACRQCRCLHICAIRVVPACLTMARLHDPAFKYLYKDDLPPAAAMASVDGPAMPPPVRSESLASDRFTAALANVTEMGQSLESLQQMLGKAVYVDEEVFANASAVSKQTRTLKAQERRIKALERELDAAIAAAGHARAEKKQAEAGQRAAEARTQEVLRELEDTTVVFKLHADELRSKQDEVEKKKDEILVLKAIIDTLRQDKSGKRPS